MGLVKPKFFYASKMSDVVDPLNVMNSHATLYSLNDKKRVPVELSYKRKIFFSSNNIHAGAAGSSNKRIIKSARLFSVVKRGHHEWVHLNPGLTQICCTLVYLLFPSVIVLQSFYLRFTFHVSPSQRIPNDEIIKLSKANFGGQFYSIS